MADSTSTNSTSATDPWTIIQVAAAIAAVPALTDATKSLAHGAAKKIPVLLGLNSTLCRSLTWPEVPDGPLHKCEEDSWGLRICDQQPPSASACKAEACWEAVVGKSLKAADWKKLSTVQKPASLARNETYLRTDMKTIMAFVIRTNGDDCDRLQNNAFPSWEDTIRSGRYEIHLKHGLAVKFEREGHVLIAHISGGNPACPPREPGPAGRWLRPASTLTKSEMDRILDGYPPFYREDMRSSTDNHPLENPLRSLSDSWRGGWVVATELASLEPVGFYVEDEGHLAYTYPPTVRKALERVYNILIEDIRPHFPEDEDLKAAIMVVRRMIDTGTGSDAKGHMTATLRKHTEIGAEISNRVIGLFNRYGRLEDSELELVKGHFAAVLQSAVWGVFWVVEYFKDTAVWIPRIAMTQEMIYLRDCGEQHR